ncbi:hypothetical protein G7054_g9174 [Neopestalotiopsis clavispora]|nr:hypothetical protein G7054_g9174 [Neopestalotiopsis clavispora]
MMPTTIPPLNESDSAEARHISNQSPYPEPWSSTQLAVPPGAKATLYSERFHSRRQSGSSASQSDRRTVITVDDPLSDSDFEYDRDYDTDEQTRPGDRPGRSTEARSLSDAGLRADEIETTGATTASKLRSSSVPSSSDAGKAKDGSILEKVQDDLESKMVQCSLHTNKYFVPYDTLRALLTESRVCMILSETPEFKTMSPDTLEITAKNICTKLCKPNGHRTCYIRIFAILVLMNRVRCIGDFLSEDSLGRPITDADLPLRRPPHPPHLRRGNLVLRNSDKDTDNPLRRFGNWRPGDMNWFIFQQETLISPRFRMRGDQLCIHRLRSNIILPFVECGMEKYEGGFGQVSKVKIHPAHCDFDPKSLPHANVLYGTGSEQQYNGCVAHDFALKKMHSNDYNAFRAEIHVLEKFSASREGHEHLIRLLAAIEHGDSYYLLFPWAQGNLADLWQRFEASPESPDDTEWLIKQCLGITNGLQRIHQYRSSLGGHSGDRDRSLGKNKGTHGDVKAENILFFDPLQQEELLSSKHIVVSDFGLTRFREQSQGSRPLGWSMTYRAPELDLQYKTSRKYDVWSLGCVSLEFISWFLLGFDATRPRRQAHKSNLTNFQAARLNDDRPSVGPSWAPYKEDKFFNLERITGTDGFRPVVKPSVLKWINNLRQMKTCSKPIEAFLNLIQSQMLVPDLEARGSMLDIKNELKQIYEEFKATRSSLFSQRSRDAIPEEHCTRSEAEQLFENMDQFNLNSSKSVDKSSLDASETGSAVEDPQILLDELERIYQESLKHADDTAKQIPTDINRSHSIQIMTPASINKGLEHQADGTMEATVDMAKHQQHNHLATRHHRSKSSPVILFMNSSSKVSLPLITATPSSAEVSRKNSLETATVVRTMASSRDDVCHEISSRLRRGNSHGKQICETTPLLAPLNESSQQNALRVARESVDTRKPVAAEEIDGPKPSDGGSSWWFRILCGCYSARRHS